MNVNSATAQAKYAYTVYAASRDNEEISDFISGVSKGTVNVSSYKNFNPAFTLDIVNTNVSHKKQTPSDLFSVIYPDNKLLNPKVGTSSDISKMFNTVFDYSDNVDTTSPQSILNSLFGSKKDSYTSNGEGLTSESIINSLKGSSVDTLV